MNPLGWLLVTCYVGMAMCRILNPHIIFCLHFSLITFSGAGGAVGTISSGHNDTMNNNTDSIYNVACSIMIFVHTAD